MRGGEGVARRRKSDASRYDLHTARGVTRARGGRSAQLELSVSSWGTSGDSGARRSRAFFFLTLSFFQRTVERSPLPMTPTLTGSGDESAAVGGLALA